MIRGIVFDFDGLILETEEPEYRSWQELYAEFGCTLPFARWAAVIGTAEHNFDPYAELEAQLGRPVDRAAVPYWEVMATVRWAVIALMQAARHYRGHESSLELALTAHVLPVLELDLLTRVREIEETGR